MTKCPLHHTKVLMWGVHEMTFQISPRIHLVWPRVPSTTPKFSCEVDARLLFKCHLASMRDDIWKVYKGKVLMWGARKITFQISPRVHLVWPSTPKFSCKVDARWLFKCHLVSTGDDIWKVYKGKVLTQGACEMTFQISPCVHLVWPSISSTKVHARWLSNFTSCPSSVTKCQCHHTKVPTQGAHERTFQISPRIHLVWPSTPKFSCKVDARWLFKCHLTSTQDNIWKVYKGKIFQIFIIWPWDIEEVTSNSKVLMWGACEMTFQISPYIHLAWPSTPKFSHKVDARWLFKCHLMSTQDDIWKVYKGKILQIFIIWPWDSEEVTSNSKVLTWGACEMTFQISPYIHLAWQSTPKFSHKVDTRWLFKCHLMSTQDDIWKVYKGKILQIFIIWPWDIEEVTSNSKVLTWGACEMTFQISPYVHLAWPSTPKFSCKVDARWLFKCHLTSMQDDIWKV